ncbi:MAG: hypothetical protein JXA10_17530, partial [Anaerolineae bacterium]|nr:hypothetical protein [Anaerolineae bacterium]
EPTQDVTAQQIEATPVTPTGQQQLIQEQQIQAASTVGETWQDTGIITALEANGMILQIADGSEIYVELGPSQYWQGLGVTLAVGEKVTVEGFYNGTQYHSATVTKADGSQMALRTADGQPLWSGGSSSSHTSDTASSAGGNTNGNANGNGNAAEPAVSAEDWVTIEGVVSTINAQQLTMQAQTGELLDLQLGSADFMAEQGISFATGDPISVLGFWQGDVFNAGEITKTQTGERLMLLDPNGRPLWAGPGRAGNNGNSGNAGNSGSNGQGSSQNQSGNSSGNGQGGNGGQGQGGQDQGQGQNQDVQVPADQWETISGTVIQVEVDSLTLTLQVANETVTVALGAVDFWTEDGISFPFGTALTVDGYWLNGQFEAGIVTFDATGKQLEIRNSFGRLLWTDTTSGGQGQGGNGGSSNGGGGNSDGGNGYQGGRNADFQGGDGNK